MAGNTAIANYAEELLQSLIRTETPPTFAEVEQVFRQAYPGYERTSILDALRATEYQAFGTQATSLSPDRTERT